VFRMVVNNSGRPILFSNVNKIRLQSEILRNPRLISIGSIAFGLNISIYVKETQQYILHTFKDNDTTKTANIAVLLAWHILTRTRAIAMLLKM